MNWIPKSNSGNGSLFVNSDNKMFSQSDGTQASKAGTNSEQNKLERSEPQVDSARFSDIITRVIFGQSQTKSHAATTQLELEGNKSTSLNVRQINQPTTQPISTTIKRSCRAPISRKFAHPCICSQHSKSSYTIVNATLPPAAYTVPLHLYDPASKKCLPTSRARDMLLKECRNNVASPYPLPHQLHHSSSCVYDDLICDGRRNRCVCKQSLHLYYESNFTSFGCVPVGSGISPDGRVMCRPGNIYNVISKECQKIFDVSELPPTYTTGVSPTQFSIVTIVLIWVLLLILIVTAKLRRLRASNLYRNSSSSDRRLNRSNSYRNQSQGASAWLHPFIAAVNGHHHLNQHRTAIDRYSQAAENGNYSDTDLFLNGGSRRLNQLFPDGNFASSQLSLNNPPPKFEEIYPGCPEERANIHQPPSNEDLPTYDEAVKLQNNISPDINQKD